MKKEMIKCTIESLTLPRFLPCGISVFWRYESNLGQTDLSEAKTPILYYNTEFNIIHEVGQQIQILFSIVLTKKGNLSYRIGGPLVTISDGIDILNPKREKYRIDSKCGYFDLTISFQIDNSVKDFTTHSSITNRALRYSETIRMLKPTFDSNITPHDLWGEGGLFYQLHGLSEEKMEFSTSDELKSIIPILKHSVDEITSRTQLLCSASLELMSKTQKFLTEDHRIVSLEECKMITCAKYPISALILCNGLENIVKNDKQIFNWDFQFESLILDYSSYLVGYASSQDISSNMLFYTLSTSTFISQYLKNTFGDKAENCIIILESAIEKALSTYVQRESENAQKMRPFRLLHLIEENYELFNACSIPKKVWDSFKLRVLETVDFSKAAEWVYSDKQSEILYDRYKKYISDYNWPLLQTLDFVQKHLDILFKNKKTVNEIMPECRGKWLELALMKLAPTRAKEIKKLVDPKAGEPTIKNLEEWASSNCSLFGCAIPSPLPSIPSV